MKETRKDLIQKVLTDFKNGLHIHDIANELLQKNLENNIDVEKLMMKVGMALSTDIKNRKLRSHFRRVPNNKGGYKQGWYKLKHFRKPPVDIAIEKIGKGTKIEIPIISSLYTGKAGEHAVLSELLFNEFNVSLMSVDQGIDIVASKDENFFHIQVKTMNYKNGVFFASISKTQFDRFNKANTFYIFVLRYFLNAKLRSDFIVLRSSDIERFLEVGSIKKGDTLNFSIRIDQGKIVLNNTENLSYYFNKFQLIK